jgi:hypothetical protein
MGALCLALLVVLAESFALAAWRRGMPDRAQTPSDPGTAHG